MQDNLFAETEETFTNDKIENDERNEMDPNIDDNVFEDVTETKVDVTTEGISTQKSLLNVAKKTKKTSDRPGSELSFQSVNEISSIGMLNRIMSHVYSYCLFR